MNKEEYIREHGKAAYDDFIYMLKDDFEDQKRLVSMEEVCEHKIYIGHPFVEIPLLLRALPIFDDIIANIATHTYTATYTYIDTVWGSIEDRSENEKSVKQFLQDYPNGYSITEETFETTQ